MNPFKLRLNFKPLAPRSFCSLACSQVLSAHCHGLLDTYFLSGLQIKGDEKGGCGRIWTVVLASLFFKTESEVLLIIHWKHLADG